MARFDNRSINQVGLMFAVTNLNGAGDPVTSLAFDTSSYDAGYTVILSSINQAAGTYEFEIQTSSEPTTGFVTVPADELIGGAIPIITSSIMVGAGATAFTRGVLNELQFVRIRFSNFLSLPSTVATMAIINGALEVAPDLLPAGSGISF